MQQAALADRDGAPALAVVAAALFLGLLLAGWLWAVQSADGPVQIIPTETAGNGRVGQRMPIDDQVRLPMLWVQSQGELGTDVPFWLLGGPGSTHVTSGGISHRFAENADDQIPAWVVREDFVDAVAVRPEGTEPGLTKVHVLKGSTERWRRDGATFRWVDWPGVWPGIDALVGGQGDVLTRRFTIDSDADPAAVRIAVKGAEAVQADSAGGFIVSTPAGSLQHSAPRALWTGREQVAAAWRLSRPQPDVTVLTLELGPHGKSGPIVVEFTSRSKAIGETQDGIAVGSRGEVVLAGELRAIGRDHEGPGAGSSSLGSDAYLAKLDAGGSAAEWITILGGDRGDAARAVALAPDGAVHLVGWTSSDQGSFPVRIGPGLTYSGSRDAFVAKVRPDGREIIWAGYVGGSDADYARGIAVAGDGSTLVTGQSSSSETTFPVRVGPDTTVNGGVDAFVAKVAVDGTGLVWAGYLGGADRDYGQGIAVDSEGGAIYVTGTTFSKESTFPARGPLDQTFNGGERDAFVAKIALIDGRLAWAGYVGGDGYDEGMAVVAGTRGSLYLTGYSGSSNGTFPPKGGPGRTDVATNDVFVARIESDGVLAWVALFGGGDSDGGYGIALAPDGSIMVAGDTWSDQLNFSVSGANRLTARGGQDAFVAKVAAAGSVVWAEHLGGAGDDRATGVAVDAAGRIHVSANSDSVDAPFPVTLEASGRPAL